MTKTYEKKSAMNEFSKMVMEALNESEKDKTLKWVKPWREIDCKYRNALSNRPYSGLHNVLACALSVFTDPRYLTFNQIRKAKGKLQKGSKATRLIAWKFVKKIDPDSGKEKTIPFATSWALFNVEQTEGLDLPPIDNDIMDDSLEINEDVIKIYDALKVDYRHEKCNGAYYAPKEDYIKLPHVQQYTEVDAWCNTALHELVHWTAHKDRVNRDCGSYSFDVDARAMEELVAELGAMYLCMQLNINGYMDDQNLAYIKSWKSAAKGKNGDRFIYKACKLAEEASKYILEKSEILKGEEDAEDCVPA
jgi:antirestriction protein ArdC